LPQLLQLLSDLHQIRVHLPQRRPTGRHHQPKRTQSRQRQGADGERNDDRTHLERDFEIALHLFPLGWR
jgi:hypothetical protein